MARQAANFTSGAAVSKVGYGLIKDSTKDYVKKKSDWNILFILIIIFN